MAANRLKNLAQVTRGALRDVRRVVNELAEVLAPRPQPSLVRIPVRSGGKKSPMFRSPYGAIRQLHTSMPIKMANGTIFQHLKFNPRFFFKPTPSGSGIANKLWTSSSFRAGFMGKGPLPSGLYQNFVQLNARNFSSYGGSASREAVQNLTSSLRCMLDQGSDKLMTGLKMKDGKSHDSRLTYHGCMTQKEAPSTFKLARSESSGVERMGSYVEFLLPKVELKIPSMTFMNSEILNSLEMEFEMAKEQLDKTSHSIQQIFEGYGSLPLERRDGSVRIHFHNLDADELERFLIDLGIDEGVVYTSEEIEGMVAREDDASGASSMENLSDLLATQIPDLLSESELESSCTESIASSEFFPVLSSSSGYNGYQYATPIDLSESSSHVIIAHDSEPTFSELSMSV